MVDGSDDVIFKRKFKDKKVKNTRKRQRHEEEEESKHTNDIKKTVEEVLEEQKLRQQFAREERKKQIKKGSTNTTTTNHTTTITTVADSSVVYGLHDPKKDGSSSQKLLNLLDGQFTGSSTTTQKSQHEELMNQYIEERLNKSKKTEAIEKETLRPKSEEDALYELPPHLIPDVSSSGTGASNNKSKEDNGVVVWSTGIAEVELPESYIQQTVKATHAALKERQKRSNSATSSSAIPANFSTDFNRHRREYVQEMNSLPLERQKEVGWFAKDGKNKQDQKQSDEKPTDYEAVSRFRKIEARKKFH